MAKKISELPAASALTGDELVEVSQGDPLASKKTTVSALRGPAEVKPFTLIAGINGKPGTSAVLMRAPVPLAVSFSANIAGSLAVAEVAATSQADFDIQKNGVSVGTLRFAASATVGTFIAASAFSVVAGDIIKIVAPATQDATLADIGITLYGVR